MTSQETFDQDYLFVRKELLAGKFTLADVKLWMKSREEMLVKEIVDQDKRFQSLVKRRMEHKPDRELEAINKIFADSGEDTDE